MSVKLFGPGGLFEPPVHDGVALRTVEQLPEPQAVLNWRWITREEAEEMYPSPRRKAKH
jgi:hypothetical protein